MYKEAIAAFELIHLGNSVSKPLTQKTSCLNDLLERFTHFNCSCISCHVHRFLKLHTNTIYIIFFHEKMFIYNEYI